MGGSGGRVGTLQPRAGSASPPTLPSPRKAGGRVRRRLGRAVSLCWVLTNQPRHGASLRLGSPMSTAGNVLLNHVLSADDASKAGLLAPIPEIDGMPFRLRQRNLQPEIMDNPGLDASAHHQALNSLARINWISSSSRIFWGPIRNLCRERQKAGDARPVRVLDVATGGGDVAVGIWQRGQRASFRLKSRAATSARWLSNMPRKMPNAPRQTSRSFHSTC